MRCKSATEEHLPSLKPYEGEHSSISRPFHVRIELNRIHFERINIRIWTLCLIGLAIQWNSGNNRVHFTSLSLVVKTIIQKEKGLQSIPETQDDGFSSSLLAHLECVVIVES